jgi:hypothetical protein
VVLHYHLASPAYLTRARDLYERAITLAERQLADPDLATPDRNLARQALEDARRNLAVLTVTRR